MATIGAVSNPDHSQHLDRQGRPQPLARLAAAVRGVAMNPVDHPHGGGEGRTSGGRHPVTPVGQADQGQEDPQQQVNDEIHPALAARPQGSLGRNQERDVARSVWKGPFFDGYLLKKAEKTRESGRNEVIKIWSRRSTVLPQFVGLTFGVYNGHKHIPVLVSEDMIGHKFGEFAPTRTFYGHAADRKAKRA